jgi:hypothetical protein
MKKLNLLSFIIILMLIPVSKGYSQESPIQLALVNPVQLVPESNSITGLRLSLIYGKNAAVSGLDWGLVNITTSNQIGIQWGVYGSTEGSFTGWQGNWVSVTRGNFTGLQSGIVTYNATKMNGLQFAIVNYAATLNGLQLGLINIIGEGGFLPVFPFFNFSFD